MNVKGQRSRARGHAAKEATQQYDCEDLVMTVRNATIGVFLF